MRLVYKIKIDKNDKVYRELERMSRVSKDLYNQALFEVKEHQKETGEILGYCSLDKLMKTKPNLEGNINYRLLPAKVAQQTVMLVFQNIKAFFAALADYKEHPEKYQERPEFPHFLPKEGYFVLVFTNQQAVIKGDGTIQLTSARKRAAEISIAIPLQEFAKYKEYFIKGVTPLFNQIRIVPKFNGDFFNVEIVYKKEELNPDLSINRTASIDLGVNNLITLVDSSMGEEERVPIIINGRPLKSINQFYNKKRASWQSELSKVNMKSSKALRKITDWRNEKINDYMHKASRFVINYCLDFHIGHIVIGKNPGWKQGISITAQSRRQKAVGSKQSAV
jgi:putative transposase